MAKRVQNIFSVSILFPARQSKINCWKLIPARAVLSQILASITRVIAIAINQYQRYRRYERHGTSNYVITSVMVMRSLRTSCMVITSLRASWQLRQYERHGNYVITSVMVLTSIRTSW